MDVVFLNDQYVSQDKAVVSVFDRGFLFADGVYEVIPVYHGKPFLLREHLARLRQSLAGIALKLTQHDAMLTTMMLDLIAKNNAVSTNTLIYLQVTRGVQMPRQHRYTDGLKPTLFMCLMPFHPGQYRDGIKVITTEDTRGDHCHIKDIAKLYHAMALKTAQSQGADEVLYVRKDHISEAASSNVFGVKNGVVYTPPQSHYILPGITRQCLVRILTQHSIPLVEKPISLAELYAMDEIWLSASGKELVPVLSVDQHHYPMCQDALFSRVYGLYQAETKR